MTNSQRIRDRPGNNVVHDAVSEIFLVRIAAQVLKRQHCDRGLLGQRETGRNDTLRFSLLDFMNATDETNPLARNSLD